MNGTIKILFPVYFLFLVTVVNAQKVLVRGKLVDQDSVFISFASIQVIKNDKAVQNKISGENGGFEVLVDSIGTYTVKISHALYEDYINNIHIDNTPFLVTFLLTKRNETLNAVIVSARRPLISRKMDRIVMDVQDNPLTTGKSSSELLLLAPGVFVQDGKISINGNPGTRIMVNGKILQLSGDDLTSYLSSLRAEQIQSIEIIPRPPAEFEAAGSGGYINIILKKQKSSGFNGSINAGYSQGRYAGTNEGIQLDYKKNDFAFFSDYSFSKIHDFEDSKFSRMINDSISYRSGTNRINNYTTHRVHVGATYDFGIKQWIGMDYTGSFVNGTADYSSVINITYPTITRNENVSGIYPRENKRNFNNWGFNYNFIIDTIGSSFTFLTDYTQTQSKVQASANSEFFDFSNNSLRDTSFRNITSSFAKIYTGDAKLVKAFSSNSKLSIGGKLTFTDIDNNAIYEGLYQDRWISKLSMNYTYRYMEKIIAGYVNYSGVFGKTNLQIGGRCENTSIEGRLMTSDIINKKKYFNFFPTLFVKHGFNKSSSNYLTFYYGKRISRPSYSDLNPYEFYADNYSIGKGNPYLSPSITNSFELGYTLKNKYTISAFYDLQKNMIGQLAIQSPADSLITIYTKENFGTRANGGLTLYIPLTITKWWNLNNNFIARHEKVAMTNIGIEKTLFSIQVNSLFSLKKGLNFNLNAFYYSNIISGNFLNDPFWGLNIGVQKKLFKNRLSLKAAVNDVFSTNRFYGSIYYSNYNVGRIEQERQTRTFSVSAIYNFALGGSIKLKKMEKSNSDEQSRL